MGENSEASCVRSPSRVGVRSRKSSSRFSLRERFGRGSSPSRAEPERSSGLSGRSSAAEVEASRGRRRSYAERLKRVTTAERAVTWLGDDAADSSDKERLGHMGLGRPAGVGSTSLIDRVSQAGQHAGAAASARDMSPQNAYRLAVAPLFRQISPRLERLVLDYDAQFDYTDLFLWATMSGKFELCKLFWPLTAKPLATAMLGSYVCRFMVGSVFIGHADIEAESEVMQGWVVGTLDVIPEESCPDPNPNPNPNPNPEPDPNPNPNQESIAHAILSRIITAETDERRFNLVDLALFLNMKRVLSQRFVQTLIDRIWRGDVGEPMYCIERGTPWWRVLLCVLPPFSPPVVGMLTGKRRKRRGNPIFIFDAFTKAKRTLEDQMHDSARAHRNSNHGPPSPVGAAGAAGGSSNRSSPRAAGSDRKSRMDPASRQRFNEQVSSAFQTSAMDRFTDDRYSRAPNAEI